MNRFILEFVGGYWDGMNLHGSTGDSTEERLATHVWLQTKGGTKNRQVVMPAGYAIGRGTCRGLRYVVSARTECQDETLVRLECFGDATEPVCCIHEALAPHVLMEFEGGDLGGKAFDSRSSNHAEALAVLACYLATDQGAVGGECCGLAFLNLLRGNGIPVFDRYGRYVVVDRREGAHQVVVTLRHNSL
jgi:hypothetical protein